MKLKRCLIAITLAALASPALALEVGPPYEELAIERALPSIEFAPVGQYAADKRAPYEELAIERMLPDLPARATQFAGARGETRTDAGPDNGSPAPSPWANDWNFIAPAQ